jgi:GNAT superfamily N-acetyltransferase
VIHLPDGADVEVRPIRPDDKETLAAAFENLSDQSRYQRFFSPHARLTQKELRYFTEVDHSAHEAIIALEPGTGAGLGVARYVRSKADPGTAEIAVAVIDAWHGRGVGTALLDALADRAREEGIERFSAVILADNEPMLSLFDDFGEPRLVKRAGGAVELVVDLPPEGAGDMHHVVRAAARGEVAVRNPGAPGESDYPSPA